MVEQHHPKAIPSEPKSRRLVNNKPDAPQVQTTTTVLKRCCGGSFIEGGQRVEITQPLLGRTITHNGGGRPIGGGISKEALNRAKQKAKKQKNGSRI